MDRGIEGGNKYSQKYPTEAYDTTFSQNGSMKSVVFQPPPREDFSYNKMIVKCNGSDCCNYSLSDSTIDTKVNTLRQTQDDTMLARYLDNNFMTFLNENTSSNETDILVPHSSNCNTGNELFAKFDVCREAHEDFLHSGLISGILPEESNLDFCRNQQMRFNSTEKEHIRFDCKVKAENAVAVTHESEIVDNHKETYEEQNNNSNNLFQLHATPETLIKQNYSRKQPTFEKGQVYIEHAMPDFSTPESPNCFLVSSVPRNDSFEQICMLNTSVSYVCGNELQKILVKTGTGAEISKDIQNILPSATINVCNMTPRQVSNIGDNPNTNSCWKMNELKLDAKHSFPEDMAKLIYEINLKVRTVPPSSTLNNISQICETAKQYCEKYSPLTSTSENSFKNLLSIFLQVAYSWVASSENIKCISLFHPDLKDHVLKWKNNSEALLDVLKCTINNWNHLVDSHSKQLVTSGCNQIVSFEQLVCPVNNLNKSTYNLSEMTSSSYFKDREYFAETTSECLVSGFSNKVNNDCEKTSKSNNSSITENNESEYNISSSSVNTCQYGTNNIKHMTKRSKDKNKSEKSPHSPEFFETQPLLNKNHKNYDMQIPRPFSYVFKNHNLSNEAKSYITYKNMKIDNGQNNTDTATESSDNVSVLHALHSSTSVSEKLRKSDFTIKHSGILPITTLEKTNTISNFHCKVNKDAENAHEPHPQNYYSNVNKKLNNSVSQQTVCSGRMTNIANKQVKRPYNKISEKRTMYLEQSENCESDASESSEYIRPGSYKIPMKSPTEMHRKRYASNSTHQSSLKIDSVDITNNNKALGNLKTCFPKHANEMSHMPHETDSNMHLNDILHHKPVSRGHNEMNKIDKTKSLITNYSRPLNNSKRQTVYWNKNEQQLSRCHSYYNARQRERVGHKKTEIRDANAPPSSLNSRTMKNVEGKMSLLKNSQNVSNVKKCKLENSTFSEA